MKRASIQEAIKANEHSRVRRVEDKCWYSVGKLKEIMGFGTSSILADWEIEEKPLELWVNIYEDGENFAYFSKTEADDCADPDRIRCVKMREVTDE